MFFFINDNESEPFTRVTNHTRQKSTHERDVWCIIFFIHDNESEPYTGVMKFKVQFDYSMHPSRDARSLKHTFMTSNGTTSFILCKFG